MSAGDLYALGAAALCVFIAAFFGAAETAYSRLSLSRAQRLAEEGRPGARRMLRLVQAQARTVNLLALILLVAEVTTVALVAIVVSHHFDSPLAVVAGAAITAAVLFVGAEVAPKTVAVQRTETVALVTARWVALVGWPLSPLVTALIWAGNVVAPGKGLKQGPFVTEDEIREMIDVAESDEVIEESERAMIHSIFELGDTVVREIMVPRPDMVTVPRDGQLSDVLDTMLRVGHSRIPVYGEDRDTIVGLIYAKDVLRRIHQRGDEEGPWDDLMRPVHFVPELMPVDALLKELQSSKVHLAIVVDEYGTTAGLVTIEDVLEEIVGEIVDEYDREEPLVQDLGGDTWRLDARLPVDELNDLVGTSLPDDEWDTVGGLLFGLLGHVPSPGERVETEGVRLIAERLRGRRISTVLVKRLVTAQKT